MTKINRISKTTKYKDNPFLNSDVFTIPKGKSAYRVGRMDKLLVDSDTGEIENMAAVYAYEEKDKEEFIKVYVNGMKSLMDMSNTGSKAFYFIMNCLRINDDRVYVNIMEMAEYCKWKNTAQCYLGLGELIANKIVAPSMSPNLWFINPKFVFNGNRILFMKEYRMKENSVDGGGEKKKLKDPLKKVSNQPELLQGSITW